LERKVKEPRRMRRSKRYLFAKRKEGRNLFGKKIKFNGKKNVGEGSIKTIYA
jgi:hypothetical protein